MLVSLQVVFVTRRTWKPALWLAFARTRSSARLTVPVTPLTWKRRYERAVGEESAHSSASVPCRVLDLSERTYASATAENSWVVAAAAIAAPGVVL